MPLIPPHLYKYLIVIGAGAGGVYVAQQNGMSGCSFLSRCKTKRGMCNVNRAVCMLNSDGDSGVSGKVIFESEGNKTKIKAEVNGLTPGKHGFHIHQLGDLSGGCKTAKGHFNPFNKNHGGPNYTERHVGDLGNIIANNEGNATVEMIDELVQLNGVNSIIGRSVVVHADEDDLGKGGYEDSLTTGHAGARVACGVIGIGN